MKRNKILLFILLAFCGLFAFACGDDPVGPQDEFKWEGRFVEDISVSEDQLNVDYDIDEWPTVKESFMLTVTFDDGTVKDFPFTDSHFVYDDRDLTKLTKVNRVRVHVTALDSDEFTFYLNMVSYDAQRTKAIEDALESMFICDREGEYLVFKLQKGVTINGGQLDLTFDNSKLTLSDPVLSLSDGNDSNYVSCKVEGGKMSIFFATEEPLANETVICKVKYSGDFRAAGLEFASSSHAAYFADDTVVEISNNDITYYVSLK